MIQDKLRQRRLQWFGHVRREMEGGVLRLVELDRGKWMEKDHCKSDTCLKGKYGLELMMMMM